MEMSRRGKILAGVFGSALVLALGATALYQGTLAKAYRRQLEYAYQEALGQLASSTAAGEQPASQTVEPVPAVPPVSVESPVQPPVPQPEPILEAPVVSPPPIQEPEQPKLKRGEVEEAAAQVAQDIQGNLDQDAPCPFWMRGRARSGERPWPSSTPTASVWPTPFTPSASRPALSTSPGAPRSPGMSWSWIRASA